MLCYGKSKPSETHGASYETSILLSVVSCNGANKSRVNVHAILLDLHFRTKSENR